MVASNDAPVTTSEQSDKQVAETTSHIDEATLASLKSIADVRSMFESAGMPIRVVSDYGTGFTILEDKDKLCGVPFLIVDARFSLGDFGQFVSLTVMTNQEEKWIVNDGSTGICDQVEALVKQVGTVQGMLVTHGLRRSDYDYTEPKTGNKVPATTYYLDMAP